MEPYVYRQGCVLYVTSFNLFFFYIYVKMLSRMKDNRAFSYSIGVVSVMVFNPYYHIDKCLSYGCKSTNELLVVASMSMRRSVASLVEKAVS